MKIYMLRILPPLSYYRKYYFESMDALLSSIFTLYSTIRTEHIDLSDANKYDWDNDKFNCFTDCIQIYTIDTDTMDKYLLAFPESKKIYSNSIDIKLPKIKIIEPDESEEETAIA